MKQRGLLSRSLLLCAAAAAGLALLTASCSEGGDAKEMGSAAKQAAADAELNSVLGAYLAGRHAERERDLKSAADFYARTLEADPDNITLQKTTFLLMLSDGREQEAMALARRIEQAEPKFPLAALFVAVADMRAGDYAGAEKRLLGQPHDGLSEIVLPMAIAWARVGQEQYAEALKALGPLEARRGFKTFYLLHAGLIEDLAGDTTAAETHFVEALGESEQPPARLVQAAASFYHRHGREAEAKALAERYLAADPDSTLLRETIARISEGDIRPLVGSARDGLAEALFDVSSAFYRESASRTGLVYGRLALMMRPDYPVAQLLVAEILESQERHSEASQILLGIDSSSIFYWPARQRIASNLEALGQTDEAIRELDAIAAERPDFPDPLIDMGDILRAKKRFKEAVAAYDRAFARIPEIQPRHWSLLYSRGIALERAKQWDRAESDFLKALEFSPDQPYVLNYLGYTWVERGERLDKARAMIEKAVAQRPNDGYIVDSLGWVLYHMGEYEDAVQHLEKAVELRPQDPVINDHLGDAYWRAGRAYEARFQWNRALSLEPEKELVPTIEAKLAEGLSEADGKSGQSKQQP